jgi:hypothetical protein
MTDRIICTGAPPNPQSWVSAVGPRGREWQLASRYNQVTPGQDSPGPSLLTAICLITPGRPSPGCDDYQQLPGT